MRKVCIEGVVKDEAEATVSVFDRGFLYGDSVFEVMRTYTRVPCFETEHLERLAQSCERVLIPLTVPLATISAEIRALIAAMQGECYLRVIITRGSGPLNYDPTTATNPLRVIIAAPVVVPEAALYSQGVGVMCIRVSRPTDDSRAAGAKASNYLAHLLATHEARLRGGYEAIVLGPGGEVLEGATSNVFAVKDGRITTPPVSAGVLAGITRSALFRVAKGLGLPVAEGVLYPRDLYDADEVFISSSIREVMPVVRVDGETVGTGRPGPVTERLHAGYRRLVGAFDGARGAG